MDRDFVSANNVNFPNDVQAERIIFFDDLNFILNVLENWKKNKKLNWPTNLSDDLQSKRRKKLIELINEKLSYFKELN